MKKLIFIILTLTFSLNVFAQREFIPVQINEKALILGSLAVEENNNFEKKIVSDLRSILNGQNYELRTSVMSFDCTPSAKATIVDCIIIIGNDHIHNENDGWNSIYKIEIKFNRENKEILSSKFTPLS